MYFAERGRPTYECVYHARWAFAGGIHCTQFLSYALLFDTIPPYHWIKGLSVNKTFALASGFWPALTAPQLQIPRRSPASFHPQKVLFRPGRQGRSQLGRCLRRRHKHDLDAPRGGTQVRLRATPRFPCQYEKSLLFGLETASVPSGVSGWTLTSGDDPS